jgi:hypothetical protein
MTHCEGALRTYCTMEVGFITCDIFSPRVNFPACSAKPAVASPEPQSNLLFSSSGDHKTLFQVSLRGGVGQWIQVLCSLSAFAPQEFLLLIINSWPSGLMLRIVHSLTNQAVCI